jgi:hypothetical protein
VTPDNIECVRKVHHATVLGDNELVFFSLYRSGLNGIERVGRPLKRQFTIEVGKEKWIQ